MLEHEFEDFEISDSRLCDSMKKQQEILITMKL